MVQVRIGEFLGKDLPGIIPEINVVTDKATKIMSCAIQKELDEYFDPQNNKLYQLLDANHLRPSMEQSPFPRFPKGPCTPDITEFEINV